MDPASIITAALVAGAAAAAKTTAERAIKDLYAGLKQFITDRYHGVRLDDVERNPADAAGQAALKQELAASGATQDADLLARVDALLDALEESQAARTAAHDLGINLAHVKAGALRLHNLSATGDVTVTVEDGAFGGDIDIGNLHAGQGASPAPN